MCPVDKSVGERRGSVLLSKLFWYLFFIKQVFAWSHSFRPNLISWSDFGRSPVIDWRPVQGVPCLRPKSAGIGSSPPATLQRIKRRTYNVYRWWMDGWMDFGRLRRAQNLPPPDLFDSMFLSCINRLPSICLFWLTKCDDLLLFPVSDNSILKSLAWSDKISLKMSKTEFSLNFLTFYWKK